MWRELLPDAAFVVAARARALRAGADGPAVVRADQPRARRNAGAASTPPRRSLEAFLDAELARRGLPPAALALVGFSQGTMMALHVGLRRAAAPAAIVGYSGLLAMPDGGGCAADAATFAARPPVLLIHGDQDDLIPAQALFQAAQALAGSASRSSGICRSGVGHGIDEEGLRHGGEFLARRIRVAGAHGRYGRPAPSR